MAGPRLAPPFAAAIKRRNHHETRPLEEVNEALDDILHARDEEPRAVLTV